MQGSCQATRQQFCAFVKEEFHSVHININTTMQHTEDLWFAVMLVTGLVINFCVCYHPPKPVYDVAEFKRHLTDSIGQIIDTDPNLP